ncbi:MAG: potassium channel family protein [Oligoflexales bacterium]
MKVSSRYTSLLVSLQDFIFSPHFVVLSTLGNFSVFIFSELFYFFEFGQNPDVDERMDAIWWAFTTVTAVGYGDIVPVTFWGRIVAIVLMIIGTVLFASYLALFADTFLSLELGKDRRKLSKSRRP